MTRNLTSAEAEVAFTRCLHRRHDNAAFGLGRTCLECEKAVLDAVDGEQDAPGLRAAAEAVLHELEHGELSPVADIKWCVDALRDALQRTEDAPGREADAWALVDDAGKVWVTSRFRMPRDEVQGYALSMWRNDPTVRAKLNGIMSMIEHKINGPWLSERIAEVCDLVADIYWAEAYRQSLAASPVRAMGEQTVCPGEDARDNAPPRDATAAGREGGGA